MTVRVEFLNLGASLAHAVAEILEAADHPPSLAVAIDEYNEAEELWSASAYFEDKPPQHYLENLADIIASALDMDKINWSCQDVPDINWVQKSLEGLKPIHAGRFFIHGAHDRHVRPVNSIAIELEAGLAFGSGHHGTTKGCLVAFDRLLKQQRFLRILDVGTGTGILAIAAAQALKTMIIASDIDQVAVEQAKLNAENNGVGKYVKTLKSTGLDLHEIRQNGPYDLIFANILARPLATMAWATGAISAPGASVILSGILPHQSLYVECAYRAQGFVVSKRYNLENWVTLCLHV